jgi:hypothetical protein
LHLLQRSQVTISAREETALRLGVEPLVIMLQQCLLERPAQMDGCTSGMPNQSQMNLQTCTM